MTPSLKKRFWKDATIVTLDDGFGVALDGHKLRTPSKAELIVPTHAIAKLITDEWIAQEDAVDPEKMPATRMANSAIDKVSQTHSAVVDMLAQYGGSDLLCYRAHSPEELIERQEAQWDPILEWSEREFNAHLLVTKGVMPIEQDPTSLANLKQQVSGQSDFALSAFHDLVALSGSLILALAVRSNHIDVNTAWNLSRIDEQWQIDLWGPDEAALESAQIKQSAFQFAKRFYDFSLS